MNSLDKKYPLNRLILAAVCSFKQTMHVPIKSKLSITLQECLMMCASTVGILMTYLGGRKRLIFCLLVGAVSNECLRCTRDKYSPKLHSSANNRNPGVVPPQLMVRFYTSAILFVVLWLIFVLKVFCSLSFTV